MLLAATAHIDKDLYSILTHTAGTSLAKVLILSAPTVIVALAVGFIISLFQAVTQIQEQTLTFVPKIIAVFLVLLITGSWMVTTVTEFTQDSWHEVAMYVRK
jgi:flagellar biosynthetic protein FliQ